MCQEKKIALGLDQESQGKGKKPTEQVSFLFCFSGKHIIFTRSSFLCQVICVLLLSFLSSFSRSSFFADDSGGAVGR